MNIKFKLSIFCSLISLVTVNSAFADDVIPNNSQTQVQNVNNVPVVNIAAPNLSRVSRNVYKEFNIREQGLVLNNAMEQVTSELVGQLDKNPNFRTIPAGLIINEVVGGNQSQLLGKLEVAGIPAAVIISNPNGVMINGLNFNNVHEATISTGVIDFDKRKNPITLKVTKGQITVGEKGLDSTNVKYLNMFGRTFKVQGDTESDYIGINAGSVLVDMKKLTYNTIEGEGVKPQFSIDTSDLGGIYANRIMIKSTEKGIGVNLNDLDGKNQLIIDAIDSNVVNIKGLFRSDTPKVIKASQYTHKGIKYKWSEDNGWVSVGK
ncbi:filamentous hemagglutinin N-terminal domain-containing protein [Xenorhabdus bovienii]|uniref:two-partner secretion domain-containing protein n=1 Tax=Xenorhabdus bovienii TaxID=40576 RepID=UPI00237CAD53|nr:filamentous hemagglutinin N-terminal domain-containing protein [Xenorhabdus bovienii]MDE1481087.1 filamentous hemagglutinin N-terminal domain-containing protein [Xenorhabdus bovienii]MDE9430921.1 filamentous hemagglutinin N-terminal domain-containing protein [Xenorhabdus bovienii]MDE9440370.1 filamentous hemagglutinin N-terminal domain-containing protein [Xenorhabdus bovienii]MDE9488565.1 filamentous hemagglutinin N-terminal domain-containing protein [Xenorhabdus bovienii]MDE9504945.1 filam